MPKPIPPNPFDSHSYSVPRHPYLCMMPLCSFPVLPDETLCELHSASTLPRQDRGE